MKTRLILGITLAATAVAPAFAAASLTAAEVKAEIAGHRLVSNDRYGSMTWYWNPGGKYDADDGRVARSGTYRVEADGRLCWKESVGVAGCFRFSRKGKGYLMRRDDPGHQFELGYVTAGAL